MRLYRDQMALQWNHKHKISDAFEKHNMGYLVILGYFMVKSASTKKENAQTLQEIVAICQTK